ncbi:MAG TPA: putative glycoside hydrolase [Steroidobacteraceae bacterium]|nr:putative glycoside hydrolase [Steroidobacteraceae bacterium]
MMIRHTFRKTLAAVAAIAALGPCASAFAFTPPPFPRLAGIEMGSQNYNDTTYQKQLAKQSIIILKYYPGMAPGGESMDTIVKQIKAINPNTLVFIYIQSDYQNPYAANDAWTAYRDKLNSMHWWLYAGPGLTNPVPTLGSSSWYTVDNSPYTAKDSNGDDSIDWITKFYVDNDYKAIPDIDGFFMDNVFVKPNVPGDWYDNGVVLQPSDARAQAAIQAGYERYFSLVRQLMPGKYQIGNITEWGRSGSIPGGYEQMADGGVLEGMIGASYSIEGYAGWQAMMNQYTQAMQALKDPKLAIFNQWGSPTDYQSFRYGFASCLMNDGYYSFTNSASGYQGVVWFDEYNAKLGQPTTAPPTSAWQKGVWRRDFSNGIALVNPKGNGTQTVQLGGTFVKIKGTQDPTVNNGQKVTSVTLNDRDGIILLRLNPLEQPKAPTGVSISN